MFVADYSTPGNSTKRNAKHVTQPITELNAVNDMERS